jgi:capsule polysaccharide export protein KpsE/RkpR
MGTKPSTDRGSNLRSFPLNGDTTVDVLERQQSTNVGHDSESTRIPIGEVIDVVVQHRRMLAVITGIGMLIGTILAFVIPNEYTCTAQLMPPDPQTFSGTSALGALSGAGFAAPSLASSLISQRTPGATAIAVLKSREIQDNIINQFDLRRVYNCKLYFDTRKVLTKHADFTEDKASGIISIAITARDRYRARDISQAYINQLNELVSSLSTSSARRERIFLGKEIESVKDELDASTLQLAQFSSRNATFDVQRQGEATVDAATRLQAALITAKSELSAMKAEYANDNVRVRELSARIAELQAQLQKMSGNGPTVSGINLGDDQPLPSLRALPLLGAKYYDLYRQVLTQGAIFETLTKQYEFAKVQEAKEIPSIKVLDPPNVPEKKSGPQRLQIVILGTLLSAFGGITWFTVRRFWG